MIAGEVINKTKGDIKIYNTRETLLWTSFAPVECTYEEIVFREVLFLMPVNDKTIKVIVGKDVRDKE